MEKLKQIPEGSIDQVVTDPPYGLKFMGKDWDKAVPAVAVWKECLRVLKSGAFAFILCSPRQDCLSQMIMRLQEAGFKTDFTSLYWTYASGFPKAHSIGKATDRKLGGIREILGKNPNSRENCDKSNTLYESGTVGKTAYITKPATKEATKVEGAYGGFQPKPAVEVILVAMKPMDEKTFVDQAIENGKGVTRMDDCRIPYQDDRATWTHEAGVEWSPERKWNKDIVRASHANGRFPANLLVSDDVLDDGKKHAGGFFPAKRGKTEHFGLNEKQSDRVGPIKDNGSYSRFFSLDAWAEKNLPFLIVSKASKKEKDAGLDAFESKAIRGRDLGQDARSVSFKLRPTPRRNQHPTVKPLKLITYLITMGSREGDIVLDPFAGSATTCVAAKLLNRHYIGIEMEPEYHQIAVMRLEHIGQDEEERDEPVKAAA